MTVGSALTAGECCVPEVGLVYCVRLHNCRPQSVCDLLCLLLQGQEEVWRARCEETGLHVSGRFYGYII